MVELFLNVVAPVFIIAGLGWGWSRLKIHFDSETITRLVMNIGVPGLIFSSMTSLSVSKEAFGQMGLAAVTTIVATAAVTIVFLKLMRMPASAIVARTMSTSR